jgi:hypothetical protein
VRIATIEESVFGEPQSGGTQSRLEVLEVEVLGSAQAGPMPARLAVLEEAYGL